MGKKEDGVKVRCPYCTKVFIFKPKKRQEGDEVRMVKLIQCPYCESGIQLPNSSSQRIRNKFNTFKMAGKINTFLGRFAYFKYE